MKFFLGVAELTCLAHLYSTRQPPLTDPGLVRVEHKRGRPIVKKGVEKRNVKIDFLKNSSTLKSLSTPDCPVQAATPPCPTVPKSWAWRARTGTRMVVSVWSGQPLVYCARAGAPVPSALSSSQDGIPPLTQHKAKTYEVPSKQDVPVQDRSPSQPPPPRLWGVPPKVGAQRLTWLRSWRPRGTLVAVVAVGRWWQRGKHIPARGYGYFVARSRSSGPVIPSPAMSWTKRSVCSLRPEGGVPLSRAPTSALPAAKPTPPDFLPSAPPGNSGTRQGPHVQPTGAPLRDRSRRLSSSLPHPRRRLCVATHDGLGRDIVLALVWPRAL
jgi:hypothetical protein